MPCLIKHQTGSLKSLFTVSYVQRLAGNYQIIYDHTLYRVQIINLTSTPQHDLSLPSNYPKRVEWPKPNQFPSHLLIFLLPRRVFHLPSSDVKGMSVESICFLATRPQIPRESHSSSHWLLTLAKSDVTLLEYPNFLPPFQIIRWSPTYAPYPTCTHLTSLHVTQAMYLLSQRVVLNLKAPIFSSPSSWLDNINAEFALKKQLGIRSMRIMDTPSWSEVNPT